MTCDVTIVGMADWNRVSIFTRQNETNFACKKRLLSFIAENCKHCKCHCDPQTFAAEFQKYVKLVTGVDKEFPAPIETDAPLEL
ncbi:hypothetical protein MBANPS3_012598 [Mucor bainieri]